MWIWPTSSTIWPEITIPGRSCCTWSTSATPASSCRRRGARGRIKPVVLLKPRRYPEEPDDAVYAAAFRRAGLLRVDDSDELLQMIEVLKAARRVHNDRLAIVGNSPA